ncbi:MAG TPA: helix-turn-helix transcriptional regulator [Candidatus Binatia bacterium]|nr:helix-turn-helix transcriptional regulator [Candidatus Binatia bacterium]
MSTSIASRMRKIREARGLSRAEVARRLKTTRMRVWRLENEATAIVADDLPAIARAIKTTVAALLGLEAP